MMLLHKVLPYLKVGPFTLILWQVSTTCYGLIRRKRNTNKQIFMITDGKPVVLKRKMEPNMNSNGLDSVDKCYTQEAQQAESYIPITTDC
jgi:hypothetical protein